MVDIIKDDPIPGDEPAGGASGWLTFREIMLLLVLAIVQFTHIVDFMIMMPLGPIFSSEMSLTPQAFGALVAAYTVSAGIAGLLAAWFLDRFDRKRALLVLYAGFITGTVSCALAPTFPLLLAARTVAGAFGGVVAALVLAIVGDAFHYSRRGLAMGVVMLAFSVASIAGVPLGLFLAEKTGWRSAFLVLGALSAAVLALAAATLPPLRGHLRNGRPHPGNTWAVLFDPNHLRAFALTGTLVWSTFMLWPFLPMFLEENVGVSQADLKYMYLCGGLATLVTMIAVGRLADRFGKLSVFRGLALFTLVPILVVTNLPADLALFFVLTVTTVFMVASSGRMVPAMALITASSAPAYRGSFMSFNAAVQQLAAGLATFVAGFLVHKGPLLAASAAFPGRSGSLDGFWLIGLVSCLATLISVVLAGRLRMDPGGDLAPDSPEVIAATH